MAETTSQAVHNATQDVDLRNRLAAAAALAGIDNPASWVAANIYRLAVAPLADGQTVASTYQYAADTRQPSPGENPGAVTDANLAAAITYVVGATP